jgi:hypothetical protein
LRKGYLYFKSMEITGARGGTAKKQFGSVWYFMEIEIPNMDVGC